MRERICRTAGSETRKQIQPLGVLSRKGHVLAMFRGGLFMRNVVPKVLLRMLEQMRKHTLSYWSDEQYNELFGSN